LHQIIIKIAVDYNFSFQKYIKKLKKKSGNIFFLTFPKKMSIDKTQFEYGQKIYLGAFGTLEKSTKLMILVLMVKKYPEILEYTKNYLGAFPDEIDKVNNRGWTALNIAVQYATLYSSEEMVRILVVAGANVNLADVNGRTPLMSAVCDGSIECANILIKAGANVNYKDDDDQTALMIACMYGHTEIVRLLLAAHANPNTLSKKNVTALAATTKTNIEIVLMLLDAGAKVEIGCFKHITPEKLYEHNREKSKAFETRVADLEDKLSHIIDYFSLKA